MDNSVDTIICDIKKLFKELETAYGIVKPQICEVEGAEKCPNTKCWVQKIRDEYSERIMELESGILSTINNLMIYHNNIDDIDKESLHKIIKFLDKLINPTPCSICENNQGCTLSYKHFTIHSNPCSEFIHKTYDGSEENIAVYF